jgi:uncharacterized membrane protein
MAALIYAAVTMYITIHLLHDSYNTNAFDLGIFTQELKYTLHGQILYSPAIGGSQFAPHFSPVLLLLVPVYWLFPHAQTLLVVQAFLLAFGGYLIYVLASEYNYSHRASLILEGLYFINPLVWGVALFDFHEVAFAIPALLVMFLGLKRKNWFFFVTGLLFALATKEDVVIATGVFGFLLMISDYWQHKKVEKTSVIIFCAALLTYGTGVIVSRLASGGESARLLSYFTNRYAYIGQPLSLAIPLAVSTIFSMSSLFLIGAYLSPFGFLPLLSPKWSIPALLILLSGIFSTCATQHSELMQYPAAAIPFLFMAFIIMLPGVIRNPQMPIYIKKYHKRVFTYSIIVIIILSLTVISDGRIRLAALPDAHDDAINQVIALVPNNATVTTSNVIFPHLCSRTNTYLLAWEGEAVAPESGIINGDWGFPEKETEYVVIDDGNSPTMAANINIMLKRYTLIKNIDGVLLYQLNP